MTATKLNNLPSSPRKSQTKNQQQKTVNNIRNPNDKTNNKGIDSNWLLQQRNVNINNH